MLLKFKPKLNSKFMLKRSKTVKIMNRSKNRGGITQVKVICFCIQRNKKYRYIMTARKGTQQSIASGFGVRSEHRIDILIAKSIGKEHLNVFLTERSIKKTVSFWDP